MLVLCSFACETCGELCHTQDYLEMHRQLRHPQKPRGKFCCTYCPYSSDDRSHVVMHERKHTGERPFVCPFCKKTFQRLFILNRHLLTVHGAKGQHQCADCAKCFPSATVLLRHRRIVHLGLHKCPFCRRGFTQQSDLKNHLIIHAGEKRRSNAKPRTLLSVTEDVPRERPPQAAQEQGMLPLGPSALTITVVKAEPRWPI